MDWAVCMDHARVHLTRGRNGNHAGALNGGPRRVGNLNLECPVRVLSEQKNWRK